MRYIFLLLASSLIVMNGSGQVPGNQSQNLVPARNSIVQSGTSASAWAKNWKLEKERDPGNANAWLNYYLWTDRNKELTGGQKKQELAQAVRDARTYIDGSVHYLLMLYLQSGKKDSASLYKAIKQKSNAYLIYPYLVQYAIITQNEKALRQYADELNGTDPLWPGLYEYHYNVLMSADSNATIYAQGLNDLVPMAIVQQVHQVRKDIRLRFYDGDITEQKNPVYLCLSLGKDVLAKYQNSFCTGLLVKISAKQDPDELKKHVERFSMDFLKDDQSWANELALLYRNYLPGFLFLYKYYKAVNNSKAGELKALIDKIAARSGTTDEVNKLLEK